MKSTFSRAVIGFIMLTFAVSSMALIALWAIETFASEYSWMSVLVTLVALATEIGIYRSTLHDPIHDWISEPKRERERAERLVGKN